MTPTTRGLSEATELSLEADKILLSVDDLCHGYPEVAAITAGRPGLYSERWLWARQAVQRFAVADLSNWYLDVAKDRLYVRDAACADRRACQTVMHALIQARLIWLQR